VAVRDGHHPKGDAVAADGPGLSLPLRSSPLPALTLPLRTPLPTAPLTLRAGGPGAADNAAHARPGCHGRLASFCLVAAMAQMRLLAATGLRQANPIEG